MATRTWRWRTVLFYVCHALPVVLWLVFFRLSKNVPREYRPVPAVMALPQMDEVLAGGLPHRYIGRVHYLVLDCAAAFVYTIHVLTSIVYLVWLVSKRTHQIALGYLWAFGMMNLLSELTHFLWPTAPPWYYERYHDRIPDYTEKGDAAGLLRVDAYFGITFYYETYRASPVVFGAFPSMHAGWPSLMAVAHTMRREAVGSKWLWLYVCYVCWAAMYLHHHYLADVLGGLVYGWCAYAFVCYMQSRDSYRQELSPDSTPIETAAVVDDVV